MGLVPVSTNAAQDRFVFAPALAHRTALEERFEKYHAENPQVYELFKKFTLYAINCGRKHFSADVVAHRIRWETSITTVDADGLKINNDYVSGYARMFEKEFPQYAGFFRRRKSKFDVVERGEKV
jgi:hypothetical protein